MARVEARQQVEFPMPLPPAARATHPPPALTLHPTQDFQHGGGSGSGRAPGSHSEAPPSVVASPAVAVRFITAALGEPVVPLLGLPPPLEPFFHSDVEGAENPELVPAQTKRISAGGKRCAPWQKQQGTCCVICHLVLSASCVFLH